jgi:glycosyltransferase involved in cell wall biosynthesis
MRFRILHHQRLPYLGQLSIERLFSEIREFLPGNFEVETATSPYHSKGLLPRVANLMFARRQRADIHHVLGDVHYLCFGLRPSNLVLTVMDCAALTRLPYWKRAFMRYFWYTGPMKRAAVVTTISQTTKDELRKWVGDLADRVEVIPCCVRSEFKAIPHAFSKQAPVALQVGTGWNKNVERVAESLRGTGCRLEIIGILNDEQRAILKVSGVVFTELGQISHDAVAEAYRRCDFVIFASLYEGFGLPILEAQATGRPVITSNRSSMPEVAGEGALFVDPESAVSIRSAVDSLLHDEGLRISLIEKGYQNVERFRPNVIAEMYAAVYQRILQSSASHAHHSH